MEKAGNRVSELVHRPVEVILYEGQRGKILKKNEEHLRGLWDNIEQSNMNLEPRKERREREWVRKIFKEIMAQIFTNLVKDINLEILEAR